MKAKFVLSVLLAALALAGLPGASSAGWCSALTSGYRPISAPESASAEAQPKEAGEESGNSVFKLTCHRCRCRSYSCYPAYNSCYPCGNRCYPSYYPSYSYYPSVTYYPSYSYYPSASYYYGW